MRGLGAFSAQAIRRGAKRVLPRPLGASAERRRGAPSTAAGSAAGPEARAGARSSAVALGPRGGPSAMRPEAPHLLREGGLRSFNWGWAGNGGPPPAGSRRWTLAVAAGSCGTQEVEPRNGDFLLSTVFFRQSVARLFGVVRTGGVVGTRSSVPVVRRSLACSFAPRAPFHLGGFVLGGRGIREAGFQEAGSLVSVDPNGRHRYGESM